MKIQFTVVYALRRESPFDRFSNGVEVFFDNNESALDKHTKLLAATMDAHNRSEIFVSNSRTITIDDICFHCVVRLN